MLLGTVEDGEMGEGSGYKMFQGSKRAGESRMILFCEKLGRIYIYGYILYIIF